jgi:predicted negative regulator of RcsB-dependent stress response
MLNRPRSVLRFPGVAIALAVLGGIGSAARADMVLTSNGQWTPMPQGAQPLGAADEPTDDLLSASADARVDATYETVKSNKGFSKPAAEVVKVRASARATNEAFRQALNDASSSFFQEAADGFATAAAAGQLFDKQEALWLRVQAFAEAQAVDRVPGAIDDLLAAFPKSFYFADAHILKAKVAIQKGDVDGATAALAAIKAAAGMNPRDLLRAEYNRINLTLEIQRKYDEAAAAYRALVTDAEKADPTIGAVTAQQALVGLGNCLLATKKDAEARTCFDRATASHDTSVLAGAYAGLGDIGLTEARALRDGGKLKEAKERLESTLLDYLRVTTLYRTSDDVGPILRSLENQARVFVALFEMSGNKDCELATRAYGTYVDLSRMLPDGPQKRGIVRAALEFDQKREAAGCKPK